MTRISLNRRLGIISLASAAFLALVAIPSWVASPSNIQVIVLSPTFWPYVLAGLLALSGVLLLMDHSEDTAPDEPEAEAPPGGALRLVALAVIMCAVMFALPRLGMVLTSTAAFLACAFLFRTRYPKTAIVCAVVIPLVLYVFFAHVAGVAIPQGNFVRLP